MARPAPAKKLKPAEQARIAEIFDRLAALNDDPRTELKYRDPFTLVVAVALSAQATDAMINRITPALFRKYRSAADYARADPRVFEGEIRSSGFFRNKAKNIIGAARRIEGFGANEAMSMKGACVVIRL